MKTLSRNDCPMFCSYATKPTTWLYTEDFRNLPMTLEIGTIVKDRVGNLGQVSDIDVEAGVCFVQPYEPMKEYEYVP